MSEQQQQTVNAPKVTVAAKVAPEEKDLARLAAEAAGEASLSAFMRRAVRDRAIKVVTERGVAPPEAGDAEVGR